MCGRYYVDDETAREIEKVIRQIDAKLLFERPQGCKAAAGDVCPTGRAEVLTARGNVVRACSQQWGFPGSGKVVFNARSETALEKRMFQDSVQHRRCVIPAAWFYEWDHSKNKFEFYRKDFPVIFMAGFYRNFQDGEHFVILTAKANESMKAVHDRMPLILEDEELVPWMEDDMAVERLLHKKPGELLKRTEYDQQTLPFL